jgi:hypothetical protein
MQNKLHLCIITVMVITTLIFFSTRIVWVELDASYLMGREEPAPGFLLSDKSGLVLFVINVSNLTSWQ